MGSQMVASTATGDHLTSNGRAASDDENGLLQSMTSRQQTNRNETSNVPLQSQREKQVNIVGTTSPRVSEQQPILAMDVTGRVIVPAANRFKS